MSYDLMVFDLSVAPEDPAKFVDWFREQARWAEGHSYDDPAVTSPELRRWFMSMIPALPAMNGPFRASSAEDANVTDYCIGRHVIYAAFSWSVARLAYDECLRLAQECGVGFFDVSGPNGGQWRPNEEGIYEEVGTPPPPRGTRKVVEAAFPNLVGTGRETTSDDSTLTLLGGLEDNR